MASAIVTFFDRVGQWMLPILMGLIVIDVIGRRFLSLPTVALQEAQWHIHGVLFLFCIGATYLEDGHVRVDVLGERLAQTTQRAIEIAGTVLFLIPIVAVNFYYSLDLALVAFESGERSAAPEGLGARWIIKAMLPVGFALLGLAALVMLVRLVMGQPARKARP